MKPFSLAPVLFVVPFVSGCAMIEQMETRTEGGAETPAVVTTAPPPPAAARTVEEFDTTTAEDRAAAAAPSSGGRSLGTAIASLGDPSLPGFWMMTALVAEETQGRIEFPEKGTSAEVTLIPSDGGSARVSLAALRLLEAPLADLSELAVFAN
jgi:hypothetical protein